MSEEVAAVNQKEPAKPVKQTPKTKKVVIKKPPTKKPKTAKMLAGVQAIVKSIAVKMDADTAYEFRRQTWTCTTKKEVEKIAERYCVAS